MPVDQSHLTDLVSAIENRVDPTKVEWPGGWPNEIEAALIDAVFSIRARYGGPRTGVRRVVQNWRAHRGQRIDDLAALAAEDPVEVAAAIDSVAKVNGRPKATVVVDAARALAAVGLRHAADFTASDTQRRAYQSVRGCGPVTWVYFGMLLGTPGVKADTWILRFVRTATGSEVSADEAEKLVTAASERLGVTATELDHAIWRAARTR